MTAEPSAKLALSVCAVETYFSAPSAAKLPTFSKFLSELIMSAAKNEGFWSGEIHAPNESHIRWFLIERFESIGQAELWQRSPQRQKLLADLPIVLGESLEIQDELNSNTLTEVSTAIVTFVKPEMKADFFDWEAKIIAAQATRPGYRSFRLQTPPHCQPDQWTSMVQFNTPDNLEDWISSDERRQLIAEADKMVHKSELRRVPSAFPGWVPLDEKGNAPELWKTALLVLLGLFPVVLLEQIFLSPWLHALHPVLRVFISLVGSVAATSFLTMPTFVVKFRWWLFPDKDDGAATLKGVLLLALLFFAQILIFIQFGGLKP